MSSLFWLGGAGFLSAFAVGPATFNIIRELIQNNKLPWRSISGFLVGDVIYILLSLLCLQTALIKNTSVQAVLTVLTAIVLFLYAFQILKSPSRLHLSEAVQSEGQFRRSFLLTISNFHLLLIYSGIFIGLLGHGDSHLLQGLSVYVLGLVLGFSILLSVLKQMSATLQKTFRKIEITTAVGFIAFSLVLLKSTF